MKHTIETLTDCIDMLESRINPDPVTLETLIFMLTRLRDAIMEDSKK